VIKKSEKVVTRRLDLTWEKNLIKAEVEFYFFDDLIGGIHGFDKVFLGTELEGFLGLFFLGEVGESDNGGSRFI